MSEFELKWAYHLSAFDRAETTPLVVDGVMFVTEAPSNVVALDAATGREYWRYEHELLGGRAAATVPAIAGSVTVVSPQDAAAGALTLHAETAGRPTRHRDKTLELPLRVSAGGSEPAPPPDDPLADYLDQMDAAFDRFEAEKSVASGRECTG